MPGYMDIIDPVHVDGFTPSKVFMQVFLFLSRLLFRNLIIRKNLPVEFNLSLYADFCYKCIYVCGKRVSITLLSCMILLLR